MTLTDWIVIAAIALVVGGALAYIIKAKKSGKKCIGCPDSGSCGSHSNNGGCGGSCSCCSQGCGQKTSENK